MANRTICMLLITGSLSIPATSPAEHRAPEGDLDVVSGMRGAASTEAAKPVVLSPIASAKVSTEELFASSDDQLLTDGRVNEQIEYFMTSGKPLLQNWLDRSARFIPLMKKIFRENNLPEDLVYVAMIESGLRLNAISHARAVGPWQFMPDTAREYGLTINQWVDERRDPVKSSHAAAAYLRDLYDRFGSWHPALASYNAGAGKIRRALLQSRDDGSPDIYGSRTLGQETIKYVPKLLAAITIARNPAHYGFTAKYKKTFRYDELKIEKQMSLDDIAVFTGCSVEDIEKLNPEIESRMTPPYARDYILRIPPGAKKRYFAVLNLFLCDLTPRKSRFCTVFCSGDTGRANEYALLRRRDLSPEAALTL